MKNATKRLLAILLAASMAFSLTACGGKKDGGDAGNGSGAAVSSAPKTLTEDEYKSSFEEIFSDFQNRPLAKLGKTVKIADASN